MAINMQVVEDMNLVEKLEATVCTATDGSFNFNNDWIISRKWIVVPVEKGRHLEEDEAHRLAVTIQSKGELYCYAVATENIGESPKVYEVKVSKEGLLEFSDSFAGLNFALLSNHLSYMIMFTSEDYNLYAGSKEFLEQVLGCSVNTALKKFQEIASDDWWKGKLLRVYERYLIK